MDTSWRGSLSPEESPVALLLDRALRELPESPRAFLFARHSDDFVLKAIAHRTRGCRTDTGLFLSGFELSLRPFLRLHDMGRRGLVLQLATKRR